ncbi:hypothetical protein GCM10011579_064840 [Streptomyces albiflavescens]|uniref:Uncharacterized protein n=1 Tax=Streptomyces albiflavescens TaxID=1623582 RepID=A0A917YBR4_9ACTN|nr:hypothetical protein [Streptomyces albiflavescens]GGN79901.1 hypothetical protein GCM10011579_064840 [Streptomyces albiflavescens]
MDSEPQLALPRRTLLKGAALTALTTLAFLPPAQAHAAVPDLTEPDKPVAEPHPSYAVIVGLL